MKYYYWSEDTNLNGIYSLDLAPRDYPKISVVARMQDYSVLASVGRLTDYKIIVHIETHIPAGYLTTHILSIQEGKNYVDNILSNNGYNLLPDHLKILL
jgi:hypothetical protein